MLASIIIITKNQKKFLEKSLPAIFEQTYKNFEVIIVDSGSTDGALGLAKNYPVKIVQITSVDPQEFNFTTALGQGVRHAKGDIIIRLSGDAVPADDNWLKAIIVEFKNPQVIVVHGQYILGPKATLYDKIQNWYFWYLMRGKRKILKKSADILGASYGFRRSLWEKFGPPKNLRQCEDVYLMWVAHKNGYLSVYTPDSRVFHTHGRGVFNDIKEFVGQALISIKIQSGYYSSRQN